MASKAERRARWAEAHPEQAAAEATRRDQRAAERARRAEAREALQEHVKIASAEVRERAAVIAAGTAQLAALGAASPRPTVDTLLVELEEARTLALRAELPDAAVRASMAKARLLGLDIERQAIVTGTPEDFCGGSLENEDERSYAEIRREYGEQAEIEFRRFVARVRAIDDGKVIEHDDG